MQLEAVGAVANSKKIHRECRHIGETIGRLGAPCLSIREPDLQPCKREGKLLSYKAELNTHIRFY